jgi:hypothetical protein
MAKSRMHQVAEELLQQSRAGKVNWAAAEDRRDAYKVVLPNTTLVISRWSPLGNLPWDAMRDLARSFSVDFGAYRLELLNESGEVVETLLAVVPSQSAHGALRETFSLAQQRAHQTEAKIDQVLEYLRQT